MCVSFVYNEYANKHCCVQSCIFGVYMCIKVSITRHAWVLAWLCCLCLDVYMLCLSMTVYAVLCVTMDMWDCECEYTCGKQIYMTICEQDAPMCTEPSNGSWVDLLT